MKGVTSYGNGYDRPSSPTLVMCTSFIDAVKIQSVNANALKTLKVRQEHINGATHWMVGFDGGMKLIRVYNKRVYVCALDRSKSNFYIWNEISIYTLFEHIQKRCSSYGVLTDRDKRSIIHTLF